MNRIKYTIPILLLIGAAWFLFGINHQTTNGSHVKSKSEKVWEKIYKSGYRARIIEVGKKVTQDDWTYQVNSAQLTKKQGNWLKEDDTWYKCDKNGNVTDHKTLVKVNITVTQNTNSKSFWLNNSKLELYNKDGTKVVEGYDYELCGATIVQNTKSNCYQYSLKKGETVTTDLIYAVPDQYIKQTKYYMLEINNTGIDQDELLPKEHCHMKLKVKGLGK
ncbi:MAG: DUF4352 domain-containing protein [Anaerostipes sp.]|nr:DUF4352 domain-containing protein [Anaerostipes sp.]